MSTVTDVLLDVLAAAGVRHVFGIPGAAVNAIVDGIRRDDRLTFVHVRHEEAGAFAASAQAKLDGRLAAVVGGRTRRSKEFFGVGQREGGFDALLDPLR